MNILHYTLGLPPYRTGGLTKYSLDLMNSETENNEVYLLFPGRIKNSNKIDIKKLEKYKDINVYELINPLPIPLLNGIIDVDAYTKKKDNVAFAKFLEKNEIEIIHIHTLMGLAKEFVEVANEKKIKIIFTTHDYFGICPKVNLIDLDGIVCSDYEDGQRCIKCNKTALSLRNIKIMQSVAYRKLKDSYIVKKIRKSRKANIRGDISNNNQNNNFITTNNYKELRNYYLAILNKMDFIHYNSSVSKEIYNKYGICNGKVLSILHSEISDNRKFREVNENSVVRIAYLGECDKYKGFDMLIDSLNEIGNNGWKLNVYGNTFNVYCGNISNNIVFNGRYKQNEQSKIFDENDLIIIPSIWKETFGFTLVEALSYGMPIVTTSNVGAKDLLGSDLSEYIINPYKKDMVKILKRILKNKSSLKIANNKILNLSINLDFKEHTEEILKVYKWL